jgi:cholesterol transport system auxiliary component
MKRICLVLALMALSGCSAASLLAPSSEPAKLYTLSAPRTVASTAAPAHWQLLIAMPDAPLDLNAVRIAIMPSPGRIDYFANVAWADRPPAMLQDMLVDGFDSSGRIAAVERQTGGLKSDFVLTCELQDFQVEAGNAGSVAHLRLTARLVRGRDRAIVAMKTFEADQAAGNDFDGAMAAFDSDLKFMLPQIVDWTLNQGNANP